MSEEYFTIRFEPNDLEELEVWYDGKQYEDAIPLNLSRPIHEKSVSDEAIQPNEESGLNFLEFERNHCFKKIVIY